MSGSGGPRASTYPVREANDLARVCDHWYYPQSPKYTGKAPHPISVGTVDSKEFTTRYMSAFVDIPYELGATVQKAWAPSKPAKSQLMACVDLASTGTKVLKNCKFDDPKPAKLPMKTAAYHLSLYEVATGRKLLDKHGRSEIVDHGVIPRMVKGRSVLRVAQRVASAMSLRPARRRAPIARLRIL